ncbi:MAG: dockerin type I repeat-containing protein, partial [Clostridia bacterium]|nr:dockerin type I repeat-containing protein [Clostridia bacterium]
VIDLAKKQIVYSVPTQGYPQSSGVLTTAYRESDGCVYVYFFDNYTPGKLRMLSDKPGQTKPLLTTHETYTLNGRNGECDAAYCLFTPDGQQAQYAICSPIADEYGTLYFKNDSACLMALGSSVKQLTVAAPPDKTAYHVGEVFDGTGLKVTAEYENGVTRDVTDYVAWSVEPLTEDDTELEIRFEHVQYGNRSGNVGVLAPTPSVTVSLTFLPGEAEPQPPEKEPVSFTPGDVDGDGHISAADARLALRRAVGLEDYAEGSAQFLACDVDADGTVSSGDARLILRASVNLEDPASWKAAQGIPQATETDPQ